MALKIRQRITNMTLSQTTKLESSSVRKFIHFDVVHVSVCVVQFTFDHFIAKATQTKQRKPSNLPITKGTADERRKPSSNLRTNSISTIKIKFDAHQNLLVCTTTTTTSETDRQRKTHTGKWNSCEKIDFQWTCNAYFSLSLCSFRVLAIIGN